MDWDRKAWMSILSKAGLEAVLSAWSDLGLDLDHEELRPAETGLVMTRGRMGGTGDAFNLGEMTVTRCSVILSDGRVGHAYVAGRSKEHARIAAILDGMMQGEEAGDVTAKVLEPLQAKLTEKRAATARKAAATKVDFFAMSRSAKVK